MIEARGVLVGTRLGVVMATERRECLAAQLGCWLCLRTTGTTQYINPALSTLLIHA